MVSGKFGVAIATVTNTGSGSHWEARLPPEVTGVTSVAEPWFPGEEQLCLQLP